MSFKIERVRAGKTVTQTAEHLGVSRMSLWAWEAGKVMPRADRLMDIAKFFGCTVDDLLRDDMNHNTDDVR